MLVGVDLSSYVDAGRVSENALYITSFQISRAFLKIKGSGKRNLFYLLVISEAHVGKINHFLAWAEGLLSFTSLLNPLDRPLNLIRRDVVLAGSIPLGMAST